MKHFYEIFMILIGLVLVGILYEGASTSTQATPQNTPPPKEFIEIGFLEFDNLFGIRGILTDLQKKTVFEDKYYGKYVEWNCEFVDLTQDLIGTTQDFRMHLKCNPDTTTADMFVMLRKDQKDKAMALSKGSSVTFVAMLSSYSGFFGPNAVDGIIVG